MVSASLLAFVLGALNVRVHAALFTSPSDLPSSHYDFVIVGGGAAGAVLANRLTEDPHVSVLLLEAGPSTAGRDDVDIPRLWSTVGPGSDLDWGYNVVPQRGLNGRSFPFARGRALGGSTATNAMAYTRGAPDDWDYYARVTGDPGWSWDAIQQYIVKNERWIVPNDSNHDGQFNPALHTSTGITFTSLSGFPYPTNDRIVQTTVELADEFPILPDLNPTVRNGVGWNQNTIGNGTRSSAQSSYLAPKFLRRRNLNVLVGAQVTRVLPAPKDKTKIKSVEYTSNGRNRLTVSADKEVILSAGSFGTPNILLHSGIGPAAALSSLAHPIPVLFDSPEVGQNLTEHPVVLVLLNSISSEPDPWSQLFVNQTFQDQQIREWRKTKSGPLVAGINSHLVWHTLGKNSPPVINFPDPRPGPDTPHIELALSVSSGAAQFAAYTLTPLSVGSVTINSSNPLAPPVIDPGFLTHDYDIQVLVEGVKAGLRFFSASAWQDYLNGPLSANLASASLANDDKAIEAFIRENTGVSNHPIGTARMSPKNAKWGVVDPELNFKGLSGLRIVDASVFPLIPSAHTMALVYILAERAADLIKASYK